MVRSNEQKINGQAIYCIKKKTIRQNVQDLTLLSVKSLFDHNDLSLLLTGNTSR